MEVVRRYLRVLTRAAIGILPIVIVFGASALGFFALAEHFRDTRFVSRLLTVVGVYLIGGGVLLVALLFFMAALGPNLAAKLFFVRDKVLTPDLVDDLLAKEAAAATVPVAPGQGVLRIIPVKPEWWLDDSYAADAAPVVTVEDVEYRLPGWDPYDLTVPAGDVEVVAWMPRRNGSPGRRVHNSVPVPEGRVGAVVFRPSSIPELPGTMEALNSMLTGTLSLFRLALAAALLSGFAYTAWRLTTG